MLMGSGREGRSAPNDARQNGVSRGAVHEWTAPFLFLEKEYTMSEIQLFVIATIGTAIVFVIKTLSDKAGVSIHRGWLTAILFAVSLGLAAAWQLPVFPALPVYAGEAAVFAGAWLAYLIHVLEAVSPLVAFATLIYNALGKQVFEKIGEKWLGPKG